MHYYVIHSGTIFRNYATILSEENIHDLRSINPIGFFAIAKIGFAWLTLMESCEADPDSIGVGQTKIKKLSVDVRVGLRLNYKSLCYGFLISAALRPLPAP